MFMSAMKKGVMRMMSVMGSYCYLKKKTSSRLKSGARFEVGGEGGTPLLGLYRYVLLSTRS